MHEGGRKGAVMVGTVVVDRWSCAVAVEKQSGTVAVEKRSGAVAVEKRSGTVVGKRLSKVRFPAELNLG